MPRSVRAFFTSSSLKWRMIASTFFIDVVPRYIQRRRRLYPQSIGGLDEYVALFSVLTDVQTLNFLVALDAETHSEIEDFQDHERADDGQQPGDADGGELTKQQAGLAIDQANFVSSTADEHWIRDM